MKTAETTYVSEHARLLALLDAIRSHVEDMPAPDAERITWAHADSAAHLREQLARVADYLPRTPTAAR